MQPTNDIMTQSGEAQEQRSPDLHCHVLKEGSWDKTGEPQGFHFNASRQEMVMQLHADGGVDIHGVRHERLTANRRAAMSQSA